MFKKNNIDQQTPIQTRKIKLPQNRIASCLAKHESSSYKLNKCRSKLNTVCFQQVHFSPINDKKLPCIYTFVDRSAYKQLSQLSQIFKMIDKERQINGVVAFSEQGQDDNLDDYNLKEIPYNPELHEMNYKICHLKKMAEQKLDKILKMCKNNPFLKAKLQSEIHKQMGMHIELNQKEGRVNAMKAQRRILQQNKLHIKKLQEQPYHLQIRKRVKTYMNTVLKSTINR